MAHIFAGSHTLGAQNAVQGAIRESATIWTVDAAFTYATGGFALTPANVGLSTILFCAPVVFSTGHYGMYTGGKIKVFSAAGTELANASTALQGATALIQAGGY